MMEEAEYCIPYLVSVSDRIARIISKDNCNASLTAASPPIERHLKDPTCYILDRSDISGTSYLTYAISCVEQIL